jgi:hypothetical protein
MTIKTLAAVNESSADMDTEVGTPSAAILVNTLRTIFAINTSRLRPETHDAEASEPLSREPRIET